MARDRPGWSWYRDAVVGQFEAAGMAQHMSVDLHIEGALFLAGKWVRGRAAILESTDVQERVFEVDLIPTKVNQLGRT